MKDQELQGPCQARLGVDVYARIGADDHARPPQPRCKHANKKFGCLTRRAWASMRMLGTWLMTTPPTTISLKAYQACTHAAHA